MKDTLKTLTSKEYLSQLLVFSPVFVAIGFMVWIASDNSIVTYIPLIYGVYILVIYWKELRSKLFGLLLPFVFTVSFMTSGGLVFSETVLNIHTPLLGPVNWLFPTSAILFIIKVFFKIKLQFSYFLVAWITVGISYLTILNSDGEATMSIFFFLWNFGMSVAIVLLFHENRSKKYNVSNFAQNLD